MIKASRVLANFDARISKIKILPKNKSTRIEIESQMYDESSGERKSVKIIFSDVAAIDFRINYFDNMVGSEAFGLYQIEDEQFIAKLVRETFERRKEVYLLEGHYDYDESDPNDMLNTLDVDGGFMPDVNSYCVYVQNVDAGVYIVVAKGVQIVR